MKDPEFFFGEQRTFIHQTAPFGEILSCKFLVVKNLAGHHFAGIRGGAVGGEHIAKQMMLLAGESHAIVFCQLIRAIGKFLIGVSIRTVAADTRFVRCVLGRIVDKANEFVLDCDKGVLDHRIGFGEIGHKLVLEINISDVIGRLGPLHIKAAPGKLFKEQPVKIGFTSQSVSSFPDNLFASSHL